MKKLSLVIMAVMVVTLLVPVAWSQTGTIKGSIKDESGQPIVGAKFALVSKETGRKYELKSDKSGHIFSLGVAPGTYEVTVTDAEGKLLTKYTNYPVRLDENILDVDMAKERAATQQSMSEEQKKQIEEVQKENTKIKGLNEKLAAAKAASDAGNFDQAVQILTEATQMDATRDLLWLRLGDAQRSAALKSTDPAAKKTGFEGSLESYKKALSLAGTTKPDVLGATYNNMADSYARLGQTEEAIKAYDQAVAANPPGAGGYYYNEGAVLTNTNKFKEANAAFDKALQVEPSRAAAWYWKGANGVNLATLGKDGKMVPPEGTVEAFNKYLELEPNGQFAEQSKAMLQALGETVQTSFGKAKPAAKKK